MANVLRRANTTAQWYEDDFPGATFPRLEKFLLHSTETESWPGYKGGASAPNATYHPRLRQIRQHFSNNRSSRALQDPSSTVVRENRDNVFQLEIVAYSDAALAATVDGLWIGDLTDSHFTDLAWIAIQLHEDLALPLTSTVTWKEGQKTPVSGVRLSGSAYDAYRGILAHMHASGNVHWDVGGFRYSRLAAKIAQLVTPPAPVPEPLPIGDSDMPLLIQKGASVGILVTGDRAVSLPLADAQKIADQTKTEIVTGLSDTAISAIQANLVSEVPPVP